MEGSRNRQPAAAHHSLLTHIFCQVWLLQIRPPSTHPLIFMVPPLIDALPLYVLSLVGSVICLSNSRCRSASNLPIHLPAMLSGLQL